MEVPNEPDPSVREAALAAMKEQGLTADNWPVEGTGDEGEEQTPSPEASEEQETATPPAGDEAVERTADTGTENEPEDGDVPTEYFGLDLSDLPSDKRAEIITRFKEQDRYVQSVQQKAAELEKKSQEGVQPEAQPEPEAELSDDDIMRQMGIDPDDEMYDLKKEMLLPQAKATMQLQRQMQEFMVEQQLERLEKHWNDTLDELEETHGKLPISRDDLIAIAVEHGIQDPTDAYARVHLTGRKTLSSEVEKFKQEAAKAAEEKRKTPPSTQSPRPAEAAKVEKPELLDPKEAALKAAEKMGVDWGQVLNQMQS